MSVVHRRIDGDILAHLQLRNVGANLDNGAGHLVTHDHRQLNASVGVLLAWKRREYWSSEILVDI